MKLYFDLDTSRLIQGPGCLTPLTFAEHKRGSGSGITLVLLRDGAPWQASGLAQMVVCVKPRLKYAPDETLAFANSWTFDAASVHYTAPVNFITERLDNMLRVSGAKPLDATTLNDLVLEVAYRASSGATWTHRSQTLSFVLHNNVYRGTETEPPAVPSEEGSLLPFGQWQQRVMHNNVTTTLATYADVTDLSFPVESGLTYRFAFMIPYITGADTQGSAWSINGPAASLLRFSVRNTLTDDTSSSYWGNAYNAPATANATSVSAGSLVMIEGIMTASASGNVIARFRCESGGQSLTAQAKANVLFMVLPLAA